MSFLDNGFYWFIFLVVLIIVLLVWSGCRAASRADSDAERDHQELKSKRGKGNK